MIMIDQLSESAISSILTDDSEPSTENTEKLRNIFNRIVPPGVYRFLTEHPDEFKDIRDNLRKGESKILDVTNQYANDSIHFSSLWEQKDIPEDTKQTLHKKLLQKYTELGGWVSQRDPEKTYVNIWIDSTDHPMPDDTERDQMYQRYLQETVPEILESMHLDHINARDVVFLARGNSVDPLKEPDKTGKLLFMKDHDGKVIAAQNMPSSSEFIFAATIHKAHSDLKGMSTNALPLVIPGNDHTLDIPGKKMSTSVSFAQPMELHEENLIEHPTIHDTSEISSWVYETLLCDSYFTPKEFYDVLISTHSDIDLNSESHEVIDIIVEHVHQIQSESYNIMVTGSTTGVDLSGMSLITKEIETAAKPQLRSGFTKMLQEWQIRIATLYKQHGYSCDELAGDGLNAYDFHTEGKTQDPKKRLDMAFTVQQTWSDMINSKTTDNDISAFKTFLTDQHLDRSFIKTALTEQSNVTLRWYSNKVDILSQQQLGPLLDQVKHYYQTHTENDTVIIVSREFYDGHKQMIDTQYVVHGDNDDESGVILSQLTGDMDMSQSPRETLTSFAE